MQSTCIPAYTSSTDSSAVVSHGDFYTFLRFISIYYSSRPCGGHPGKIRSLQQGRDGCPVIVVGGGFIGGLGSRSEMC